MLRNVALAAGMASLWIGAFTGAARADTPALVADAPPEVAAIRVDEKLGGQVPLDLAFRDHEGNAVTLGDLVRGDLPVVLTFNYSSCPMLCSMQLNGFVDGLVALSQHEPASDGPIQKKALRAGDQFRIVTVILEPKEELARAVETRDAYLAKAGAAVQPDGQPAGWTFLLAPEGDTKGAAIRALADAVGFRYEYQADRAEYAHPAALVYLSPTGLVTRYVHGITYTAEDLYDSTIRAGTASPAAAVGFLQRCFHYEPKAGHARTGFTMMRVGAGAFAALVLGLLLFVHLRKSRS